jgi:hypothetical protein
MTRTHDDVVVGNYHHKYTSTNPAIRWLTTRFMDRLDTVFADVATRCPDARVVEIGCGEGEVTKRIHRRWRNVVASYDGMLVGEVYVLDADRLARPCVERVLQVGRLAFPPGHEMRPGLCPALPDQEH